MALYAADKPMQKAVFIPKHGLPSGAQSRSTAAITARIVARKLGYSPRDDGKLADFLFDQAHECSNCLGWFCDADMADDDDPWVEAPSECRWCAFNLVRAA